MKKKRPGYFRVLVGSLAAMLKGMRLSGRHYVKGYHRPKPLGIADPDYFKQDQGPITIQYPMQKIPVPDTGRYRLHMETDDCIGCDKCARICPVDCITIETFRADGDLGRTTDGTMKRLHLPVFDIDMAKCMYCGLCTTVCPTECLTMTPVYDFSEYDRDNFIYHFGAYSPTEEERIRTETEAALAAKKAAKAATPAETGGVPPKRRPVMQQPPAGGDVPSPETPGSEEVPGTEAPSPEIPPKAKPRPMMRPIMKRTEQEAPIDSEEKPKEETSISPELEKPSAEEPAESISPETSLEEKPVAEGSPEKPIEEKPIEQKPAQEPPKYKPRPPRPIMKRPENTEGGPEA